MTYLVSLSSVLFSVSPLRVVSWNGTRVWVKGRGQRAGVKTTHCVVSMVLHHIPPDADGKSVYAVNKIQGHSQLQVGVGGLGGLEVWEGSHQASTNMGRALFQSLPPCLGSQPLFSL